jgi:hypothetical protein
MALVPYERVVLHGQLSAEEVIRRLAAAVEPRKRFRISFLADHKPYQGEITGHRFSVSRIIGYRNSFLPTVDGVVRAAGQGAVLEATLMPHPVVLAFMGFWLSAVLLGSLAVLSTQLPPGRSRWLFAFPAGMLLFGYLLMQGGFWFEARRAKDFLHSLASSEGDTSG